MTSILCKTILIAEDNDDIREALGDVLRNEGYRVQLAKNGKEALRLLRRLRTPALVLVDLMMPVMNGWEFIDVQKSEASLASHRVVTISAVPATESLQDPTPLKTAGALSKPLSLKSLLDVARQFCQPATA